MPYYSRYTIPFACRDGYNRRVVLKKYSTYPSSPWAAAEELIGLDSPFRVVWGQPGGHDLYPALPGSSATLRLADRIILDDAGPYGWQMVLEIELTPGSGAFAAEGTWYVRQDRITYEPYERTGVTIGAEDGVRHWKDVPFADSYLRIIDAFQGVLESTTGIQNGLHALMTWRPDMPAEAWTDATEPLANLITYPTAWSSGSFYERMQSVLASLARRFMLTLFPSQGAWYLMQRTALPRPSTGGVSTAPVWTREEGSAAGTPSDMNLVCDATGVRTLRGERAETRRPVRAATCTYAFEPELDNIVLNPEFEREGLGGEHTAALWTTSGRDLGTSPYGAQGGAFRKAVISPTAEDLFLLQVAFVYEDSYPRLEAVQDAHAYVPAADEQTITLSGTLRLVHLFPRQPFDNTNPPRLHVQIGDYSLRAGTITVSEDALKGNRTVLDIDPLLDGVTGAEDGTVVLPKGATVYFGSGKVAATLLADAAVGDTVLSVSLEEPLTAGDAASFLYFIEGAIEPFAASAVITGPLSSHLWTLDAAAYLRAVDGAGVFGEVSVGIYGGGTYDDDVGTPLPWPEQYNTYYTAVERLQLRLEAEGSTVQSITWQASAAKMTYGTEHELEEQVIGDGPALGSYTRLAYPGALATYDTFQGEDTNWTENGVAEDAEKRTLDRLAARLVLKEEAGALDRLLTTLLFRPASDGTPTRPYAPHQVLTVQHAQPIIHYAMVEADTGDGLLTVRRRVRPGTTVTLAGLTYVVTECAGGDPYVLHLDTAVPESYDPGTQIYWRADYWWDRLEWDPQKGEVFFEGTELYRSDVQVVEQVITEA